MSVFELVKVSCSWLNSKWNSLLFKKGLSKEMAFKNQSSVLVIYISYE